MAANTVRKGAPSKLFAHAYPVIVEFMRVDYIPFTAPFDAHVAVYEVAAILKDNVRVETSTQLAETHTRSVIGACTLFALWPSPS